VTPPFLIRGTIALHAGGFVKFLVARTFVSALAKLAEQQQKAVWETIGELQANPNAPGLQFHRLTRPRDPDFWSVRVNDDLRIIVHKASAHLLAYAGHHEDAYKWAERRRIGQNSYTGSIQIVEVRELVEDAALPEQKIHARTEQQTLFGNLSRHDFLSAGVPEDWIGDLRRAVTEDDFLRLADHLSQETAEILLQYVTTGKWYIPEFAAPADPFAHPDTLRNFWKIENSVDLQRALAYPSEQWAVFLHPSQRRLIEMSFAGPARISGSAGTGKTVVALHRAARLAQNSPRDRVLLTTYSQPLADALAHKLRVLAGENSPVLARITVAPFAAVATELYQTVFGEHPQIAPAQQVRRILEECAQRLHVTGFGADFLDAEWTGVVDAWQIASLYEYRQTGRIGRGSRLGDKQRERLWSVFEAAYEALDAEGAITWPQAYRRVTEFYRDQRQKPFKHIVVDESQDLDVSELRFLSAIAPPAPDALFFAGDLGQRIFRRPFSWKELGVDISGRSFTLKVNYRTSQQIRQTADRLLPAVLRDADGTEEVRNDVVSVFSGPEPVVRTYETDGAERAAVAQWIGERISSGVEACELAVLVRSKEYLGRAHSAVKAAGCEPADFAGAVPALHSNGDGRVAVGLMELAKGFEFRAVAVMACDDKAIPADSRVVPDTGDAGRADLDLGERQLLYVGCSRAREYLHVSGVAPASPFLADLIG
jgi:superfamily I DNA/RNA helicase/mRNA-degrading endonuclease RelE of RelBE toxin-antitoxin system